MIEYEDPMQEDAKDKNARIEAQALTFYKLQKANIRRGLEWTKDCDVKPGLSFAGLELAGEAGEACNAIKKRVRWELGMPGGVEDLQNVKEELADVVICASLVANKLGIDLGMAVRDKFNATSIKHNFKERL